ncbi:hypothetical protein HDU92_007780 [Lobulomyces angularis]|nr:hypothetical protein HDU92_007780 [Lobulomyces angularis]
MKYFNIIWCVSIFCNIVAGAAAFHKITFSDDFPSIIKTSESFPINFKFEFPSYEVQPHTHLSVNDLFHGRPDIYRLFITLVDENGVHLRHLFFTEMFCYNGDFGYSMSDKNRQGQPNKFYLPSFTRSETSKYKIKVHLVNQDLSSTSFTGYSKVFSLDNTISSVFDRYFLELSDGNLKTEVSIFESMWTSFSGPKLQDIVQTCREGNTYSTQTLSFAVNGTLS